MMTVKTSLGTLLELLTLLSITHHSCQSSPVIYVNTSVMPATHTQETCTRNWYKSSCTRNLHVCRSIWYQFFFWYQFLARNRTQLYSITETVRHMTRTVQRDWPESCFGARNCDELESNFSCKFLVQVERVSPALDLPEQQILHNIIQNVVFLEDSAIHL